MRYPGVRRLRAVWTRTTSLYISIRCRTWSQRRCWRTDPMWLITLPSTSHRARHSVLCSLITDAGVRRRRCVISCKSITVVLAQRDKHALALCYRRTMITWADVDSAWSSILTDIRNLCSSCVRVYTVDLFSSFTPVSRKTKNETVLRFSSYRF